MQRALEADLGLPPGALDRVKQVKRPDLTGIEDYVQAVDADAEKLAVALDTIKAYFKFWTDVFDATQTDDPSIVVDEALYRLFQFTTLDLIKLEHPRFYAWMRLIGIVTVDVRLTLEETFAPEVPGNIFSGAYWDKAVEAYERGYQNFRLDQRHDFVLRNPDLDPNLTEDQRTELRQLGVDVFGFSDLGFVAFLGVVALSRKKLIGERDIEIEQFYSWELPFHQQPPLCIESTGFTGIPISDHIASRMYTTRISTTAGAPAKSSATITQGLLVDRSDHLGWLFSLRGAVTFEEKAGSKQRPVKVKLTIEARDGLDVVFKFRGDDHFVFAGAPDAAMKLSIQPEQPSTVAPAIALPDAKGTRLEIGDYTFSVDIAKEGFKARLALRKSAFVIAGNDADSFIAEVLGTQDRRIEFDLAVTADQDGISVDGGGKLETTISLNRTIGPVTVKTVQLSLLPDGSETSSELGFTAATSFSLEIGPVLVVVEQIGFTVSVGTTSDPAPPDALPMPSGLLYLRNLGFKPPTGLGITVDGDLVKGGGFLFYDKEHEEYAGVLQLEFGPRWNFKAIGLLTTKLPDGRRGYSFLIILSVELDPPWRVGPLAISGLGGLFGLRRALDTDALRTGLRNRTLDAILFPQDPVANAGRYIAAIRTVFPPAADKHVAGPMLQLSWGVPALVKANIALLFEWGQSSRRALVGQLHVAIPPSRLEPIIELHVDAAGIWDRQSGDFSLDATLYDSHIAFIRISGDVAIRMHHGEDAFFLFSMGGYHPEFAAPPAFPKLQRLKIVFADSDSFKLIMTGYLAVTSNTKQFGADVELKIGAKGFSLEARLSFDALFTEDAGYLVDFDVEVKLKYKGTTFFGISVSGRLTGPEPKRVQGEWTLDLWLFSVTRSFDKCLGEDRPPAALPSVDPLADLVAALKVPGNWSAPLPGQSRMLVGLRSRPGSGEVLVHPLGEISVRQQLLPLGLDLDRYAGGVPAACGGSRSQGVRRQGCRAGTAAGERAVRGGDFLELTDDEKLHRKSFETMPAGVTLPEGARFGAGRRASRGLRDRLRGDRRGRGRQCRPARPRPSRSGYRCAFARLRAGGALPLRAGGAGRFSAPGPGFASAPERFAVAGVDDLNAVDVDGLDGQSQAAVRQALERHLREPGGPRHAAGRPGLPGRGADVSRYRYLPWVRAGAAHAYDEPGRPLAPVLARPDGKPLSVLPSGCCQRADARRRAAPALRAGRRRRHRPARGPPHRPAAGTRRLRAELPRGIEFDLPDFPWLFTPAAAGDERAAAAVARARRRRAAARDARCAGGPALPLPRLGRARRPSCPTSPSRGRGRTRRWSSSTRAACRAHPRRRARPEPVAARLPAPAGAGDALPRLRRARVRGGAQGGARGRADERRRGPARTCLGRARRRRELPVYYHWEFATGSGGDFETLARRLKPRSPPPTSAAARSASASSPSACRTAGCWSSRVRSSRPGCSRGRCRATRSGTSLRDAR